MPIVSPTTPAHFRCGRSGRSPMPDMANRMRRCTGLRPSRTSGIARAVMTDNEYARNDSLISVLTGVSMIWRANRPVEENRSGACEGVRGRLGMAEA